MVGVYRLQSGLGGLYGGHLADLHRIMSGSKEVGYDICAACIMSVPIKS